MNEYVQFSAKTKNEAITKACIELGVSSDQLDIQVITEGSTGFFGFGSKPAIIKVRKLEVSSEEAEIEKIVDSVKIESFKEEKKAPKQHSRPSHKAEKREEPAAEEKEPVKDRQPKPVKEKTFKEKPVREPKEKVQKEKPVKQSREIEVLSDPEEIKEIEERALVFLREVFSSMELGEVQITSKYNTKDGCLEVDFEGQDMGILIGKRGQTLDSLQYLTSLVVNKGKSTYIRVKLDTEDYRRRRKETLENLARGIAYKVKKTRKPTMGIVQQIFSDQLLKISLSCQLLQLFKHRESLNLGKSFFITVQPVSKHCQTVHQSLGPGRKISLSVSEFHTVDTCIQSFSVNSIGCDIFKSGTDDLYKLFFFVRVCSLCHNIKIRLHDSVIIGAINVHADLSVQKSLF